MSATAGTTVYGAFDPLLAVADLCKKYKIWMHVDVSIPWGLPLKCPIFLLGAGEMKFVLSVLFFYFRNLLSD